MITFTVKSGAILAARGFFIPPCWINVFLLFSPLHPAQKQSMDLRCFLNPKTFCESWLTVVESSSIKFSPISNFLVALLTCIIHNIYSLMSYHAKTNNRNTHLFSRSNQSFQHFLRFMLVHTCCFIYFQVIRSYKDTPQCL